MNTILNLYIKKRNLEVQKAPWKIFLEIYRFLVKIWRFPSPLEKFYKFIDFCSKIRFQKATWKIFQKFRDFESPLENLDLDGLNCGDTCKFLDIIEIFIGREAKFHKINTEKFFRINPNEIRFRPYQSCYRTSKAKDKKRRQDSTHVKNAFKKHLDYDASKQSELEFCW